MVFTLMKPFSLLRAIKGLSDEVKLPFGLRLQNIIERRMLMTSNQIKYWEYKERARNNRAVEAETNRSNLARETETNRANLAREAETHRMNRTAEYQRMLQRVQDDSHFKYTLREQQKMNEHIRRLQNKQMDETIRSNKANEEIRRYSSETEAARAAEAARTNRVNEAQRQNAYNEQVRSTLVAEKQNSAKIAETHRSNLAAENQRTGQLTETQRSNLADENIRRFQNVLSANRLEEDRRHNRETESLQVSKLQQELFLGTLHEANQAYQSWMNRQSNIDTALIRTGNYNIGGIR